ncbi:superfamily II DNA/RNA helicase [Paenibacillus turicensis]|uniref:Superfamily II DNA/RNA helicase n=1 Tax=Paenibacillus turicensis TaxID=160487 RepID=A0ABS4FSV2_9BACL|nr:DEAD/DEAH box helicase [Paenibacillus turicensis]MBP1905659.1 superfamily II DNA/RNA helicase [Paenibacillus turicensis]
MTLTTFAGLGISNVLVDKLADYGITTPSQVQAESIPAALEGKDILAQSQTGTGKTLAYLLPLLQRINPEEKGLQAIILAPTQELAMQIQREAENYGEPLGISSQPLIGGAAIKRQLEKLRLHPHLVVGTPGRIREIVALRKLKLHTVKMIVVDEVDQMFQLGGKAELEHILRGTLKERQLLFLSATINDEILQLAQRQMQNLVQIGIEPETKTAATLTHLYITCDGRDKVDYVRRLVRQSNTKRVIVFVNHVDRIAEVEAKLNYVNLEAGGLYGDADKTVRSLTLRRFREGKIEVLVASDIASRGLDIEELELVINFDPPIDSDHYVHRSGRTGRMGRKGTVISLVTPQEQFIMNKFAKELDIEIAARQLFDGKLLEAGEHQRKSSANTSSISTPKSKPKAKTEPKKKGSNMQSQPTNKRKSKKELELERKNKGAPRWLKDKK